MVRNLNLRLLRRNEVRYSTTLPELYLILILLIYLLRIALSTVFTSYAELHVNPPRRAGWSIALTESHSLAPADIRTRVLLPWCNPTAVPIIYLMNAGLQTSDPCRRV